MTAPNPRARHETPIWVLAEWEALRSQLIARRKSLGLTQVQLSERMGRSRDFAGVLENNMETIPNMVTLMIWVKALRGHTRLWFPGDD